MSEGEKVVRGGLSPLIVARDFVMSSVGAKVIMGLTGLGLWVFIIAHMIGNLQVFQGAEPLNDYGEFLRTVGHGAGLWVMRAGMMVLFPVHILMGVRLAALNRAARGPVGYRTKRTLRSNMAALTMAASGLIILAFLVLHLAHFTWGWVLPEAAALVDDKGRHDVFRMVWIGFKTPWIVFVYVVGQGLLFAHLFHGTASLFQSLGIYHASWSPAVRVVGRAVAIAILAGNVGIPVSIFLLWGNP